MQIEKIYNLYSMLGMKIVRVKLVLKTFSIWWIGFFYILNKFLNLNHELNIKKNGN